MALNCPQGILYMPKPILSSFIRFSLQSPCWLYHFTTHSAYFYSVGRYHYCQGWKSTPSEKKFIKLVFRFFIFIHLIFKYFDTRTDNRVTHIKKLAYFFIGRYSFITKEVNDQIILEFIYTMQPFCLNAFININLNDFCSSHFRDRL